MPYLPEVLREDEEQVVRKTVCKTVLNLVFGDTEKCKLLDAGREK